MSTLCYALLTNERYAADSGKKDGTSVGLKTYIDAVLALVPAEVLTLHATIISVTTEIKNNSTTITDQQTLKLSFYGLIFFTFLLYAIPRIWNKTWNKLDYVRIFIPPLAFIGWTMLQRVTAFDAAFSKLAQSPRTVIALFLAVILGLLATLLANKVNQQTTITTSSSQKSKSL